MIWCGAIVPWSCIRRRTVCSVMPPALLVAEDRDPVHRCDVDGVARGVLGDVARAGQEAVAALQGGDARPQAGLGQVLERREHAAVDLAGADVVAAALVYLDALVGEDALLEQRLRQQHDLTDRHRAGLVLAVEHVAARGAVDRPWPRAASSRRGSASGRCSARRGPPGGSRIPRGRPCRDGPADAADDRPADHVRALLERAQPDLARVEAVGPREVVLVGLVLAVLAGLGVELLLEAAGLTRAREIRMREQALLDRSRCLGGGADTSPPRSRAAFLSEASTWRPADAGWAGFGSALGAHRAGACVFGSWALSFFGTG